MQFPAGWTPNALVAHAPGLVAEPLRLRLDARHEFALRRGGLVRVVRGVRPPEGVELTLRRKDGLPLRDDAGALGKVTYAAGVTLDEPAVVVGPFVPGDVALVVECGRTVLADVTAHVVADETVEVRLPLADAMPRR